MTSESPSIFVDGLDLSGVIRTGTTKQFHRKSRTGCQRCRIRRVKCDEGRPCCRACIRYGSECVYDRISRRVPLPKLLPAMEDPAASSTQADEDEPKESRERRMAELELMHFYVTETGPSIPFDRTTSRNLYVKAIPRMAFRSEALLYSIFAMSALHKTTLERDGGDAATTAAGLKQARDQHERYSRLAFQRHRLDLSDVRPDNIDVVFMTANLMRLISSFILSRRVMEPYRPPVEWLRISKSHYHLYATAWDMAGDDRATQISSVIRSADQEWREAVAACDKGDAARQVGYLLHPCQGLGDPSGWDEATRDAYLSTTEYIGELYAVTDRHDKFPVLARRLVTFPILVDAHFVDLVEAMDPRALVILGHYFALYARLRDFWFVGNAGDREVKALAEHVPVPWRALLDLPLRMLSNDNLELCAD